MLFTFLISSYSSLLLNSLILSCKISQPLPSNLSKPTSLSKAKDNFLDCSKSCFNLSNVENTSGTVLLLVGRD